jgi:cell division protein FtsL
MAALTVVDDAPHRARSVEPTQKPDLKVVRRRRRWPMLLAGFIVLLVLAAMLGAAIFHTQLAERQLEIDDLGTQVQMERDRYNQLRQQIASQESPQHLTGEASRLGLVPAPPPSYAEVDKWALARQLAAAGAAEDGSGSVIVDADPLEQFQEIKSVAGQP